MYTPAAEAAAAAAAPASPTPTPTNPTFSEARAALDPARLLPLRRDDPVCTIQCQSIIPTNA